MSTPILEARALEVVYDGFQVLWGPSLAVWPGEIVCLLGPNGAGKSTVMNSISGLVRLTRGSIWLMGERIDGLPPHVIVQRGLAHVLERRRVFPYLTVEENLRLGGYHPGARPHRAETLGWVYTLFPRLRERRRQLAHTLSGGEQQMLALGRGLMARPKVLLVDEPTLGLAPKVVEEICDVLRAINRQGTSILLIEQSVDLALAIAHRGYVLESGRLVVEGTSEQLRGSTALRKVFLGV